MLRGAGLEGGNESIFDPLRGSLHERRRVTCGNDLPTALVVRRKRRPPPWTVSERLTPAGAGHAVLGEPNSREDRCRRANRQHLADTTSGTPPPRRRSDAEVTPRHLPFPESSEVNSAFCRFHCTCGAHGTPRNAGLSSRSIMGFDVEGVANPSVCFALVTERKLDHP
jgi:hypothetical protein